MIAAIADTHTALWYVFADARLSAKAKETIEDAAAKGLYVGVSAISLAEVVYLVEKHRIAPDALKRLQATLQNPDEVLIEIPVDGQIVERMQEIPREQVPDLPDRIVAATALCVGTPVISRDGKIQATALQTVW